MSDRFNRRYLPFFLWPLLLLAIWAGPVLPAQGQTVFVDVDATGAGDGSSFADAFTDLQDVLDQIDAGILVADEVFVAAGRYTPTTSGDRAQTFRISDGLRVVGGFSGDETGTVTPGDRPENFLALNPTIFDGDFDDDSDTATDDLTASFTVVTFTGPGVLDGVIVTGGNDDRTLSVSGTTGVGGGVLIEKAADGSTVINSILRDNDANALQGASICGFNAGYNLINSLVTETGAGDTLAEIVGAAGHRQDLTGSSGVDAQIRFDNVTIAGNGGFVYAENEQFGTAQLTIENSVITQNGTTPALAAGTSLIVEADAQVTNTVLEDAFISECGTLGGCTNVVEVLSPGSGGPGNEAQLTDDGFFTVLPGSPALDFGDNALLPADATDTDGDGDTTEDLPLDARFQDRVQNGTVDAGWAESTDPLPVELGSFTARADGFRIVLEWTTLSELNNAGFHIEHNSSGSTWLQMTDTLIPGAGTTESMRTYRFTTDPLSVGPHRFRLRQIDSDGMETWSDPVSVTLRAAASRFELSGQNPAARETQLNLQVDRDQVVEVTAFDALGRQVAVLFTGEVRPTRSVNISFDVTTLSPGLYFVRAVGESFTVTRRIVVVR